MGRKVLRRKVEHLLIGRCIIRYVLKSIVMYHEKGRGSAFIVRSECQTILIFLVEL